MEEFKHYLYRHIRLDKNEPFYVGIGTKQKNTDPYHRSKTDFGRNTFWLRVVNKTAFKTEIILESNDYSAILNKEIEFIKIYGRRDLGLGTLTNLTNGGEGCEGKVVSEKTRKKLSKAAEGRVFSQETRDKISQVLKKIIPPAKSVIKNKLPKIFTPPALMPKLSVEGRIQLLRVRNSKKVLQFSKGGDFIKEWESMALASVTMGIQKSSISLCCQGKLKTAGGYIWRKE